ncbi:amino acid adenylation domain-containing protein [Nostoc sp. ChiQUE01b]|uniref:amino acid adenylation domain-containing protein n=1 Tax=Nostoc sp. ChiQUE01b TaxID=3075376 RepID=UPI002AD1D08C|nr:amino acid adenylation domain-containing protein [Nostoc sp. ChiQUE01b]MDZ8262760.1 amino acid adenylation domain-containing protein [Nostoc sp. ChiQUE01b]
MNKEFQAPDNVSKFHSLSYGQQGIWFLYQTAPESIAYNIFVATKLCFELDLEAWHWAWQKIIERHPILRTAYITIDSQPFQVVHPSPEVETQVIDASGWREDYLKTQILAEASRPFDLERGSVLRVRLFTRSKQEHIQLITIHQIAGDMWSFDILHNELRCLYTTKTGLGSQTSVELGKRSVISDSVTNDILAFSGVQYTDYALWQSEMLASAKKEKLWNYWQKQLAGELPILNLPTDRQRPPLQSYDGSVHSIELEQVLILKLKALEKSEGTSLYTILLAAFFTQLYRYTGQEDILVGSLMAGRSGRKEFKEIVGYFTDPVVLRAKLSGNLAFDKFLAQIKQTVFGALRHQDYPFSLLVEKLQLERDPSRHPLLQTTFVWQRHRWIEPKFKLNSEQEEQPQKVKAVSDFVMERYLISQQGAMLDLNVAVEEFGDSIYVNWRYNTDLFDAATITRMAGHFQTLLEGIVTNPQQQLSNLPLLREAELHQLLIEWNDTTAVYPHELCIHHLFEQQVERTPNAVAVVFQDQQLTYGELNCKAERLAQHLRSLGVRPETLVGICVERSMDMAIGILSILKAGGAYVPLDPVYPRDRLHFMLRDSNTSLVVTQKKLENLVKSFGGKRLVLLDSDEFSIEKVVDGNNNHISVDEPTPKNLAYVIYTSGTTGLPKGVAVEHQSLVNMVSFRLNKLLNKDDVAVAPLSVSISFDASVSQLFVPLAAGGKVIIVEDLPALQALMQVDKITFLSATPSSLETFFLNNVKFPSSIQAIGVGAETVNKGLIQKLKNLSHIKKIINVYGPTEAAVHCGAAVLFDRLKEEERNNTDNYNTVAKLQVEQRITIGKPIQNVQIYILDSYLQPVPIGVPGELHIGGVGLARGYLNAIELTAEKFIANPFSPQQEARLYKTGDKARYLSDGNIEFLGRIDQQVKIRGFRIELEEIEANLKQHPAVQQTVVIAREDATGHEILVAYIVPSPESIPKTTEMRQYLKQKLPQYMIPNAFVILDTLPLTTNGKIDRRTLPAPNQTESELQNAHVLARNTLEQELVNIWEKLLNISPIGITDNFFELGGHSLLGVHLIAQIQQRFGQKLSLRTIFQASTIEQLALILRQQTNLEGWSPLVKIQPNGSKQPFFCLPGIFGSPLYLNQLAYHLGSDQPFYGLQYQELGRESQPFRTIEEMAACFLEAIQTVQPHGPYLLGGHSFGSKIAFEMAQQLHKQGQEVALLAVLDTLPPVSTIYLRDNNLDDAKLLTMLVKAIEYTSGKSLHVKYEVLHSLETNEQLNYIKEKLQLVNFLPTWGGTDFLRRTLQTLKANFQLHYAPNNISPTRIILFRASEVVPEDIYSIFTIPPEIRQESTYGWSQFMNESVETYLVPGNHITMVVKPHVQTLVKYLKVCLDRYSNNI